MHVAYCVGDVQGVLGLGLELVGQFCEFSEHFCHEVTQYLASNASKFYLLQSHVLVDYVKIFLEGERDRLHSSSIYKYASKLTSINLSWLVKRSTRVNTRLDSKSHSTTGSSLK